MATEEDIKTENELRAAPPVGRRGGACDELIAPKDGVVAVVHDSARTRSSTRTTRRPLSSATSGTCTPGTSPARLRSRSSARSSASRRGRGSRSWKPQYSASRAARWSCRSRRHRRRGRLVLLEAAAHARARRRGRERAVEGDVADQGRSHELDRGRDRRRRSSRPSSLLSWTASGASSPTWSTGPEEDAPVGDSHVQEVVRHPDLLGIREQGPRVAPAAHQGARQGSVLRRGPHPDRDGDRAARRRQIARPPEEQLPRLHLRRDGDERGGLAPRQGHPQGDRVHRQPAARRR